MSSWNEVVSFVKNVVHCHECKHYKWWLDDGKQTDRGYCEKFRDEDEYDHWWDIEPDGFCAWGEKR